MTRGDERPPDSSTSPAVIRGRADPDELAALTASLTDHDAAGPPATVLRALQQWRVSRRAALLHGGD